MTPNRPVPKVELIEVDAADRPFHSPARWTGAPASELDRYGYRVDEYLITGSAHWYVHSPKAGGAVVDPAQPELAEYRTRAYVVRPRAAAAFSGNVLVEGFNPSLGHDLSMLWSDVGGPQMADGDVFVGFTYKASAARVLAAVDPGRYGTIVVPNDRVQWDLIRDVLALSRGAGAASLLGDLTVAANVIMTGGSQASGLLQAFIAEGLHEPAGAGRQFPTADGYILNVSSGAFGPFGYISLHTERGWAPPKESLHAYYLTHQTPLDDPRRIARGLEVPVVLWQSENEAIQEYWVDRPDSDAPGDLYRCWQVPGRGHGAGILPLEGLQRDWSQLRAAGIGGGFEHFHPSAAHPESAFIISAMLDGMRRWRNDGVPMAKVPRLEYDAAPVVRRDDIGRFTTGLRFQADDLGHVTGGVRYPTIDVPVDIFWEVPSEAFPAVWMRDPMPREWIEKRYRSAERWLAIATGALDRAIELGTVRIDHRSRFIEFLRTLVASR
jgi:hypothetical protein